MISTDGGTRKELKSMDDRNSIIRSSSGENKMTIHDFNFIKVLGKGSFGKVNFSLIKNVFKFLFNF